MNCTNANRELGFDNFAECDYNKHWSFSNFNRMLMAAGHIARLPSHSKVLELGAGTSNLENIVKTNFKRDDIEFIKVDGDDRYELTESITIMDISLPKEWHTKLDKYQGEFDCVVYMEVIEHLIENEAKKSLEMISAWLKPEGLMLLTTPTPPLNAMYESEVWPTDHKKEFTLSEIRDIINVGFKVVKETGWSLEEREYNKLLESDNILMRVHGLLREAFPESYIRAIIATLARTVECRQVFMVCKKRRIPNGYGPDRYDCE